jgi:hypothetical protein
MAQAKGSEYLKFVKLNITPKKIGLINPLKGGVLIIIFTTDAEHAEDLFYLTYYSEQDTLIRSMIVEQS